MRVAVPPDVGPPPRGAPGEQQTLGRPQIALAPGDRRSLSIDNLTQTIEAPATGSVDLADVGPHVVAG